MNEIITNVSRSEFCSDASDDNMMYLVVSD
jgi:hypothetical protein